MSYTVNLDCKNPHIGRDGKFPLLLRIFLNGEQDYLNIGRRIYEKHYKKKEKVIDTSVKGHSEITSFVNKQKVKVEAIINSFEIKGEVPTISKVKDIYQRERGLVKSKSFYDFVEEKIEWERKNTQKSSDTLDNYADHLYKLMLYRSKVSKQDIAKKKLEWEQKKYLSTNIILQDWLSFRKEWVKSRSKLSIHDIDKDFLNEYKSYIIKTLGQANNTAYHAMCFLRKYTKMLYEEGKISPYPFAKFTVGTPFEVELEYLEPEELNSLYDLYQSKNLLKIVKEAKSKHARDFKIGEKYQEVLRYFLVACYAGLRHSDIKTLERKHIRGAYIIKTLIKGREGKHKTVRIPIRKKLFSLLDMENQNGLVFENPVMEDSQSNKYLKAIMKEANINRHITFHKSRYTFAIVSLIKGLKFEVVSEILGHSDYTTTQRYAKVANTLRDSEMDKWDIVIKNEFLSDEDIEIICPKCENQVLKFEKGTIKLTKLPCMCQHCSTQFSFLINNILEPAQMN